MRRRFVVFWIAAFASGGLLNWAILAALLRSLTAG